MSLLLMTEIIKVGNGFSVFCCKKVWDPASLNSSKEQAQIFNKQIKRNHRKCQRQYVFRKHKKPFMLWNFNVLQCKHVTNITVYDTVTQDHPVHGVGGETVNKPFEGGGDVAWSELPAWLAASTTVSCRQTVVELSAHMIKAWTQHA